MGVLVTIAPLIYELLERHSQGTERIADPVAQLAEQLTLNQLVSRQSNVFLVLRNQSAFNQFWCFFSFSTSTYFYLFN